MVVRLLSVLQAPLRAQNAALRAAGFADRYPEPDAQGLPPEVERAIEQMMTQQEPFPLTILGGDFRILRNNRGAAALFEAFVAEPTHIPAAPDILTLFFDPRLLRPFIEGWEAFARSLLNRLQRELLQRGGDARLQALLDRLLALPGVPSSWRHPELSTDATAAQCLRLTRDGMNVRFLVAVTKFSAPQQVALEELSIESCFPLDDATRATCRRLVENRPET